MKLRPFRPAPSRGPILWAYLLPIVIIHALALLAMIPWLFSWTGLVIAFLGLHLLGNLGITLCYHRLLVHHSFQVPRWLERTFTVLAMCCMQDTPAR